MASVSVEREGKRLRLRLTRPMFPFVPGGREVWVDRIAVIFGASDTARCGCPGGGECPCPRPCEAAVQEVDYTSFRDDDDEHADVRCFADHERPGLYCGVFDTRLGPLTEGHGGEFELRFPADTGRPERMFLLCRYRVHPAPHRCQRPTVPGRWEG